MSSKVLIYKDKDGSMKIDENTLNVIRMIQGPLAVCVIVGPYRSGKSFLMNNLLGSNESHTGQFKVGHLDKGETPGIMLSELRVPVKSSNCAQEFKVLLMDTEVS